MPFEIWIRTHFNRLDLALKLKAHCEDFFGVKVRVLNTGECSPTYSEKFIVALHDTLLNLDEGLQVLILEDDMVFSRCSKDIIDELVSENRTHTWFSIPSKDAIRYAIKCSNTYYRLENFINFHYSGAILFRSDILLQYVEDYLLHPLDSRVSTYDITLSSFLKKRLGHLILCPSLFGSDLDVKSSIAGTVAAQKFRSEVCPSELDYLLDRTQIV